MPIDPLNEPMAQALRGAIEEWKSKERRQGRKRTDLDVEENAGFKEKHLTRIFSGNQKFRVEHIYKILAAINMEPADFFSRLCGCGEGAGTGADIAEMRELLRDMQSLDERIDKKVAEAVESRLKNL